MRFQSIRRACADSTVLASAVLKIAAMSRNEWHALGLNGRAFAQREFAHGFLMDRLEEMFHEVVGLYREETDLA